MSRHQPENSSEARERSLLRMLEKLRRENAPLVDRAAIVRLLEMSDCARLKAFYAELDRRWSDC